MMPSEWLATRYEAVRAHVLHGHHEASLGAAIVRRQGLPTWMTLVAAEEAAHVAPGETTASTHAPCGAPAMVRSQLLAAFTDLLIGAALGVQEVP